MTDDLVGAGAAPALARPASARSGSRRLRRSSGLLAPLLLLGLWQLSSSLLLQPASILPAPADVYAALRTFFFGPSTVSLAGVVAFSGAGAGHIAASVGRCLESGSSPSPSDCCWVWGWGCRGSSQSCWTR